LAGRAVHIKIISRNSNGGIVFLVFADFRPDQVVGVDSFPNRHLHYHRAVHEHAKNGGGGLEVHDHAVELAAEHGGHADHA